MSDKSKLLAKLRAYKARPDIFKGFEESEIADLIIFVLERLAELESQINKK